MKKLFLSFLFWTPYEAAFPKTEEGKLKARTFAMGCLFGQALVVHTIAYLRFHNDN